MDKIYTKEGFKEDLTSKLTHIMGVMPEEATDEQYYKAIAIMCKDRLAQNWFDFRHKVHQPPTPRRSTTCAWSSSLDVR